MSTKITNNNNSCLEEQKEQEDTDLMICMFKQRTEELLYESRKLSEKIKETNMFDLFNMMVSCEETEMKGLKNKLYEFHLTMLNFMRKNQMETNIIMKTLCDDIHIAYKTIDTSFGSMFTCETKETDELDYVCSQSLEMPKLTRQPNFGVPKIYEADIGLVIPDYSDKIVTLIKDVSEVDIL